MLLPGKSICLIIHLSRKTHDLITEDPSVHFLQILGDRRPEFHLRQDILLQVYARSDLRQCQHTVDQFEDSALSDVKHLLSDLPSSVVVLGFFRRLTTSNVYYPYCHNLRKPGFYAFFYVPSRGLFFLELFFCS